MYKIGDIVEGYSKYYEKNIFLYVLVLYELENYVCLRGYKLNKNLKIDKRTKWETTIDCYCDVSTCRIIKSDVTLKDIGGE